MVVRGAERTTNRAHIGRLVHHAMTECETDVKFRATDSIDST